MLETLASSLGVAPGVVHLIVDLALAIAFAGALAFLPGSVLPGRRLRRELAHAVLLIGGASAMAIVVIGDSTARAFGLVGLGAFVRFRTPLRDPRDAAAMFMAIGLGMAAGIEEYALGLVACVIFTTLLSATGAGAHELQTITVRGDSADPSGALSTVHRACEAHGRVVYGEADRGRGHIELRVETQESPDVLRGALAEAYPEARGYRVEAEG